MMRRASLGCTGRPSAIARHLRGRSFDDRRDIALMALFIDSGARLAEVANLELRDLDLDLGAAHVLGKGRCERALPLGLKAAKGARLFLRVGPTTGTWSFRICGRADRGALTTRGIQKLIH